MSAAQKKGWYWPFALAGLLVAGIAPAFVLIVLATNDPSFAVEERYYEKALAWDETMAQRRRNAELGWQVEVQTAPVAGVPGLVDMTARVLDRDGNALEGCRVSVETFHNARSAYRLERQLEPVADGLAQVTRLPMRRPGIWELRLRVERGDELFTAVLDRELVAGRLR
jgi:nitrogen fixation protein FixH